MATLPTVEAMLERQARAWEIGRRMADDKTDPGPKEGPWVTISRQLGSGGNELAERIAEDLQWQIFDREILTRIAEHTHTRQIVLRYLDEQAVGPVIDYISRLLNPEIPGQADFLREMLRVVWGMAKKGQVVILGRGANWFLDPRYGLRVRVMAPLDVRVDRVARRDGIAPALAEKTLRDTDERQAAFVRRVFGREIDDPLGYDLVLNLGLLDLDSSAQAVRAALRRRFALD